MAEGQLGRTGLVVAILGERTGWNNFTDDLYGSNGRADGMIYRARNSEYALRIKEAWKPILSVVHARRDQCQKEAEVRGTALGHKMGPWSPLQTSRCRKCGMTVKLPNVLAKTNAPDIIGRAVSEKCSVNLQGQTFGVFEQPNARACLI